MKLPPTTVAGLRLSLKVTTMLALRATSTAPATGVRAVTAGGVVSSAPVVKVQLWGISALSERSFTPAVRAAV